MRQKSVTRPRSRAGKNKEEAYATRRSPFLHAAEHGLETIIEADKRPEVQDLVRKLEQARSNLSNDFIGIKFSK